MNLIIFLISAVWVASSERVVIEPHPNCQQQAPNAVVTIKTEVNFACISPQAAFRDLISKNGFE